MGAFRGTQLEPVFVLKALNWVSSGLTAGICSVPLVGFQQYSAGGVVMWDLIIYSGYSGASGWVQVIK